MSYRIIILILALVVAPHAAFAAAPERSLGLGVEALLGGGVAEPGRLGAASLTYETSGFRIQGLFGLSVLEDGPTLLGAGARVFFPLHSTSRSDFSVGPGLGLAFRDQAVDDDLVLELEALAQLRFFVVDNVALHANVGLGMLVDDRFALGLGGTLSGGLGVTYFF